MGYFCEVGDEWFFGYVFVEGDGEFGVGVGLVFGFEEFVYVDGCGMLIGDFDVDGGFVGDWGEDVYGLGVYVEGDVFIEVGDFFDMDIGGGNDFVVGDDGIDVNFVEGYFDVEFVEDVEKIFCVVVVFVFGVGDVGFDWFVEE